MGWGGQGRTKLLRFSSTRTGVLSLFCPFGNLMKLRTPSQNDGFKNIKYVENKK